MTPGDFRIGDVQINQFGKESIGQQFISNASQGDPLDRLPDDAMSEFIRAVAQSLAALELSRVGLEDARRTIEEIRAEAAKDKPERGRLRQLAASLRRILEEASGHALATVLLGTWHP